MNIEVIVACAAILRGKATIIRREWRSAPTPAQMRCLLSVAKRRTAGRTRLDVFLRCIASGWIEVRARTQSVMTAYSVLTRQGRAALKVQP